MHYSKAGDFVFADKITSLFCTSANISAILECQRALDKAYTLAQNKGLARSVDF